MKKVLKKIIIPGISVLSGGFLGYKYYEKYL